jgi:hypothetical protein
MRGIRCLATTRSPHRARGHGPAPGGPAPDASRAGRGLAWCGNESSGRDSLGPGARSGHASRCGPHRAPSRAGRAVTCRRSRRARRRRGVGVGRDGGRVGRAAEGERKGGFLQRGGGWGRWWSNSGQTAVDSGQRTVDSGQKAVKRWSRMRWARRVSLRLWESGLWESPLLAR